MKALFAVIIAGVLFGIYVGLYIANHHTPVPEGCENLKPDCAACGIRDCAIRTEMMSVGKE